MQRPSRAVSIVLVATVAFSIGLPLLGVGSFHATDVIGTMPPWSQDTPYDFRPDNGQVTDTVNGVLPARAVFRDRLLAGDLPMWDPLRGPGEPLATIPNVGTFSPLTLPYLLLPLWLAPVLTKLVEAAVATVGMFLLCRAWGLRRSSSLLGALAFVNSAFLVVWTNWPQALVGSLVPLLLWAVERACTASSPRRAWPVAVVSAVMWLTGFPSVTAYALLTAGVYAVVRCVSELDRSWAAVRRLLALAGAVLLGLGLAAVQLLPFLGFLDGLELAGRARVAGVPLPWQQLATLAVPDALGNPAERASYGPANYVEGQSWVGVVVLVLVALLLVDRRGRRGVTPRGVLPFLAAVGVVGTVLVYLDTPLLELFGQIPLLGTNNIGRFRAVLGFVAAGAAAVGYETFVSSERGPGVHRAATALGLVAVVVVPLVGVAVGAAAAADRLVYVALELALPALVGLLVAVVVLTRAGRWSVQARHVVVVAGSLLGLLLVAGGALAATGVVGRELEGVDADSVAAFARSTAFTIGIGLTATALVIWSLLRQRRSDAVRTAAALAIPVLLAAEAIAFANPWFARTPRELFFPPTSTHAFLAGALGEDRFAAAETVLYSSTNAVYGLRSLTSHTFMPPTYREYLRAVEPDAFARSSTFPFLVADERTATSPLLDRAAARYWAVGPLDPIVGDRRPGVEGGRPLELAAGDIVGVPVAAGVLRGVTLELLATADLAGRPAVVVDVRGPTGALLASGSTRLHWWVDRGPLPIAVPEVDVPTGSMLEFRLAGATAGTVTVAADDRTPAHTVTLAAGDGLRLVHTDGAVVYERLRALSRIRWAGHAVSVTTAEERLARLAGDLPPGAVVLGADGPVDRTPSGATVEVVQDVGDAITVRVDADGDGFVVVADGIQQGWRAALDGRAVPVLPADHAFGAVRVPSGVHVVRLWYHPVGWTTGQWSTLCSLVVLAGWMALDHLGRRRRDAVVPRSV